ncbi:HaaA family cyclophane-containing RiPP peptide [Streptomyces sp. WM4235]|uniref:HaaA family cyclophane-containing RiPP peptide n=2 Tax=Streptomyces TaxID=1883 RepID=UPI002D219B22|nr:HaaA family cyclophane-containing RiPP peptide [Streptomyces sp. WM4235]
MCTDGWAWTGRQMSSSSYLRRGPSSRARGRIRCVAEGSGAATLRAGLPPQSSLYCPEERRMPSRTPVPAPHAPAPVVAESINGSVVLDRVAVRVRQRLAAEQTASNHAGEGGHQASLIWTWPL